MHVTVSTAIAMGQVRMKNPNNLKLNNNKKLGFLKNIYYKIYIRLNSLK